MGEDRFVAPPVDLPDGYDSGPVGGVPVGTPMLLVVPWPGTPALGSGGALVVEWRWDVNG